MRSCLSRLLIVVASISAVGCGGAHDDLLYDLTRTVQEHQRRSPLLPVVDSQSLPTSDLGKTTVGSRFAGVDDPGKKPRAVEPLNTAGTLPPALKQRLARLIELGDQLEASPAKDSHPGALLLPDQTAVVTQLPDLKGVKSAVVNLEKEIQASITDLAAFKLEQQAERAITLERINQLLLLVSRLEQQLLARAPTPTIPIPDPSKPAPPVSNSLLHHRRVTFACGAVLDCLIPSAGGMVQCPIHRNWVQVTP